MRDGGARTYLKHIVFTNFKQRPRATYHQLEYADKFMCFNITDIRCSQFHYLDVLYLILIFELRRMQYNQA